MTWLGVLLARAFGRGRTPAELESELSGHIDLLAADLQRSGLPASAA